MLENLTEAIKNLPCYIQKKLLEALEKDMEELKKLR